MESKAQRLIVLAQKLADQTPDFYKTKGPGVGDRATNKFMEQLRRLAKEIFGGEFSEAKICGDNNFTADFYFPDEETVVEIAFSLDKPINEFERDIFKCLLAQNCGHRVRKLILVSKPGGEKRQEYPGPKGIKDWVKEKYGLEIEIWELNPAE